MSIADVFGLLFQRADATQTFWNLYLGVVTVIVGVLTAKPDWFRREVRIALTCAFVVFAVSNFLALDQVRQQRESLAQAAIYAQGFQAAIHGPLLESAAPPSRIKLRSFHFVLDLFVVVAIWYVPVYRSKQQRR